MGGALLTGLIGAIAFLTRVPVRGSLDRVDVGRSLAWFPLVGAGIGALAAATYAMTRSALTPTVAAVLAVVVTVTLTGALHEDGLADVVDAFGGGRSVAHRLEILDDPRHGTFGVLALCSVFVLRVASIAALGTWEAVAVLPCAHALSRMMPVVLMRRMPFATTSGLGATFASTTTLGGVVASLVAGLGGSALLAGPWCVPFIVVCAGAAFVVAAWARRKIGGIGGDVLGAAQQLCEAGVLVCAVAAAGAGWVGLPWWRT